MPKWVYPLAFLFVLFLIATQPDGAGGAAGEFGGFLVDLLGAIGEFLSGLLEGASDADGGTTNTTAVESSSPGLSTGSVSPNAAESVTDGFTHSHGDLGEHTHTTPPPTTAGN